MTYSAGLCSRAGYFSRSIKKTEKIIAILSLYVLAIGLVLVDKLFSRSEGELTVIVVSNTVNADLPRSLDNFYVTYGELGIMAVFVLIAIMILALIQRGALKRWRNKANLTLD